MVFTVILSIILILVSVLLFIPVDVGVEYLFKQNKTKIYFCIKFLNMFSFKIPINTEKKKKTEEKETEKEKTALDAEKFSELTKAVKEAYNLTKEEIKEIAETIRKKITFKEIYFDVLFSTGNAAYTGIMTGTVWTCSSFLIRIIDEIFGVKKININVTPCFEGQCFNIHIKSILRLKVVNIIIVIIKIMKIINIFKEKISINNEKAVLENGRTSN